MRILAMTGSLHPIPGNNANLLLRLLPFLAKGNEVRLLSTAIYNQTAGLPSEIEGTPVYWVKRGEVSALRRKLAFPAASKLLDPSGNSDLINELYIRQTLREIQKDYPYDAILSSSEPYPAAATAASERTKKVLYLMDPPERIQGELGTQYRERTLDKVLRAQDCILTTPFIRDALMEHSMDFLREKIHPVGFPMIVERSAEVKKRTDNTGPIRLLFCGWMCSELRSPQYFLDIVSRLDERFEVTFMGKECEKLQERFPTKSKATLITLPNQPYDVALQAMADADVLINIGNSVPVHMPSKTLEYINTGKPMVNFYKFADCPTLYYTKRYPLALNLFEEEKDLDAAVAQFVRFCEDSIGKTVDHDWIESEYADCTPRYIAQKILESLEK